MTLRLSTGYRDALNAQKAEAKNLMTGTTISFSSGTGADGNDQILDSGNGLGGFSLYDKITVAGSTSNDGAYEILAVADGAIDVAASTLTAEDAGDQVILAAARGGSVSDLFRHSVLCIYSGSQPTSADDEESGSLLVTISLGSGTFTAGSEENGLNFDESANGVLSKRSGEVWSGVGVLAGTAGWFRIYDNSKTTGASTTAIRMDGAIATSGSDLNMSNTSITSGGTTTLDSVTLTRAES